MRLFCFFAFLLLFGCENQSGESRFEKIAAAYCDCTSQLAALNEQTARLAADTNAQTTFRENLRQIQDEYVKAKECAATAIASRYGRLGTAQLDSVAMVLTGKCAHFNGHTDLLQEMLGE